MLKIENKTNELINMGMGKQISRQNIKRFFSAKYHKVQVERDEKKEELHNFQKIKRKYKGVRTC